MTKKEEPQGQDDNPDAMRKSSVMYVVENYCEDVAVDMDKNEETVAVHPLSCDISTSATVAAAAPTNLSRTEPRQAQPGAFAITPTRLEMPGAVAPVGLEISDEIAPLTTTTTTSMSSAGEVEHLAEAVTVEEDERANREDLERDIRKKIHDEAIQANVVPDGAYNKRKLVAATLLVAFIFVVVSVVIAVVLSSSSSPSDPYSIESVDDDNNNNKPTLTIIQERGYVICGVIKAYGTFLIHNDVDDSEEEVLEGLNIEQCRAMALLALGDPNAYDTVLVPPTGRFQLVANRTIDILITPTTHTMSRDVYQFSSMTPLSFTPPYVYSGLIFSGAPEFVECAENLEDFEGVCRDLRVCVIEHSTHLDILKRILSGSVLVPYSTGETLLENLVSGVCNVAATEPMGTVDVKRVFNGPYTMGTRFFSKEPLSLVTRQGDPEWSSLAAIAVNAFIYAEEQAIANGNKTEFPELVVSANEMNFDESQRTKKPLSTILVEFVSEIGSYGDIYLRYHEDVLPRGDGLNTIYGKNQSSGLLYSIPFGRIDDAGPSPNVNGTLETILNRGYIKCGALPRTRGRLFASNVGNEWTGFDIDFCRALAAALFGGNPTKVQFESLIDPQDAYVQLDDGVVDVVAGSRLNMQAMYEEKTTLKGYTFSSPYFYDNESKEGYGFMTRQQDGQWSDFVYWIVMSTIYAEEQGITASNSSLMPVVELFGQDLKQVFRDCVSWVGNYGHLYNRSLEEGLPRSGANRLNEDLSGPQMWPIPAN